MIATDRLHLQVGPESPAAAADVSAKLAVLVASKKRILPMAT
jgi:hypothetical protein